MGGDPVDGQVSNFAAAGIAIAIAALTTLTICLVFSPHWETNDDVAMSMIAHGYGLANSGSPDLVFSNVAWGHLVRALPWVGSVPGYSLATMLSLATAGAAICYALIRSSAGLVAAGGVTAVVLLRPVFFPQFTIDAGLLTVAALAIIQRYSVDRKLVLLVLSASLAMAGFLIRREEFLLVLLVGLPLFPWPLARSNPFRVTLVVFGIVAVSASVMNGLAYNSPEWSAFRELDPVRAAFTDFSIGEQILRLRPELVAVHGYTPNDLRLVARWFFDDESVADPARLRALVTDFAPVVALDWTSAAASLGVLLTPAIVYLVPLLAVSALSPRRRPLLVAGILAVCAIVVAGALGRPGTSRIYVPLLGLIGIFAFLAPFPNRAARIASLMLLGCALSLDLWLTVPESIGSARTSQEMRAALRLPTSPVVVWGGAFPYTTIYPVFLSPADSRSAQLYSFSVFVRAPFSISRSENLAGRGFLDRLASPNGVLLVASPYQMKLLAQYCIEHLGSKMKSLGTNRDGSIQVRNVACPSQVGPAP